MKLKEVKKEMNLAKVLCDSCSRVDRGVEFWRDEVLRASICEQCLRNALQILQREKEVKW